MGVLNPPMEEEMDMKQDVMGAAAFGILIELIKRAKQSPGIGWPVLDQAMLTAGLTLADKGHPEAGGLVEAMRLLLGGDAALPNPMTPNIAPPSA